MRIGIDIDNVCNNLVEVWIKALNEKYSTDVKITDITSYNICNFFKGLSKLEIYSPLYDDKIFNRLSMKKDSDKYMKKLIDDGHEIKLITNTDYIIMPSKLKWVLHNYPFLKSTDIYVVCDKSWIDVSVLLDDCLDNLNGNYVGVCYNYPWNKEYDGLKVDNWQDFYRLIHSLSM